MMKTTLKYNIPETLAQRSKLRKAIDSFVSEKQLSPPLSMEQLSDMATQLSQKHELEPGTQGWLMVELNNCVWRETVASIPFEKRILLLPKCLSNSAKCKADVDEFGLLCNLCSNCSIPDLQDKAESLGMMSIVAEGFTSVISLIENKVVDTVIGVSCLHSLEKAFPLLINHAVPGLAIPLNNDGCKDTTVDLAYVNQLMSLHSEKESNMLDYNQLKHTLHEWFSKDNLQQVLSPLSDPTSLIAREWLSNDGKRWRPYLLAASYLALSGEKEIPKELQLAAIAIECFHKASLVHDDIEDDDDLRYGKETVNAAHGVPMAINVGDMYLGEGYRLLAQCGKMELIKVAAEAHLALCKGQGLELGWSRHPRQFNMDFVLEVFCNKTVPAFDVSLMMGVICSNNDLHLRQQLNDYSRALGIAYQLQDDIEDFETDAPLSTRPSAVLAAMFELHPDEDFINALLYSTDLKAFLGTKQNTAILKSAINKVQELVEAYRLQAIQALEGVKNIELKRLLFRVTKKILK
ncbi:polyprenyl synthetase family protein [Mangrovibacterium marinum]|nr:polyprenyl synthetase family protein [Mangrovibacterium marinum]